jgi:acyl-CoA hydrolase
MSITFKKQPGKNPSESEIITTQVVFPNDTNPMGMLHGGKLIQWMDNAAAVCAQTHAERIAVTVALDQVLFRNPAKTGDIITIKAKITRAFNSSMEIFVKAWARRVLSKEKYLINEAYFTFVAIDDIGTPVQVPRVIPVTDEEKTLFDESLTRKKNRTNK